MTRSDFIAIWGTMADLARAIGEGETTVRNWFLRGSIPTRYDERLFEAARERGFDLTPVHMHEVRKSILPRDEDGSDGTRATG